MRNYLNGKRTAAARRRSRRRKRSQRLTSPIFPSRATRCGDPGAASWPRSRRAARRHDRRRWLRVRRHRAAIGQAAPRQLRAQRRLRQHRLARGSSVPAGDATAAAAAHRLWLHRQPRPAIASKPPVGPVIARPPVVVAPPASAMTTGHRLRRPIRLRPGLRPGDRRRRRRLWRRPRRCKRSPRRRLLRRRDSGLLRRLQLQLRRRSRRRRAALGRRRLRRWNPAVERPRRSRAGSGGTGSARRGAW